MSRKLRDRFKGIIVSVNYHRVRTQNQSYEMMHSLLAALNSDITLRVFYDNAIFKRTYMSPTIDSYSVLYVTARSMASTSYRISVIFCVFDRYDL